MDPGLVTAYHSDPEFKICRLADWQARLLRFMSVGIWGRLPAKIQRKLSAAYASHYTRPYSRWIIKPYTRLYYKDRDYLLKFKPPGGKTDFENFQDFFIREFRNLPKNEGERVWPCEGLLCDSNKVGRMKTATVKCNTRTVATIFGVDEGQIPEDYTFTNIFLHNKNYHRIHAPVSGTISRIQHVPGDLVVLRPWIYRQNPSFPAFRNERYNIDITDQRRQIWHLSVVGGPAVGSIRLPASVATGAAVEKLQELAVFYLGSTCCMAAPAAPRHHTRNSFVEVGATY